MRRHRGLIALLIVLLILAAAQYALQRYANAALDSALSQCRGWADVQVAQRHFWLWGTADLDQVQVTPSAWVSAMYGLPLGYSFSIKRIHLHHPRLGWRDGPVLRSVAVDADDVSLPLPGWQWQVTVARDARGRRLQAPTLRSLGLHTLSFNLRSRLQFPRSYRMPRWSAWTAPPGLAHLSLDCALQIPEGSGGDPGRITIRRCALTYRDLGLLQDFERKMARINGIKPPTLKQAIVRQLGLDAERSHWPLLNTQALQQLIRQPDTPLRLSIKPERPLSLDRIPRGLWPGLPAFLGLSATVPNTP